jgi:hypothetical protein
VAVPIEDEVNGVDGDDLHVLRMRRLRQLFADRHFRSRHGSGHGHGESSEPRPAGDAETADRGDRAGRVGHDPFLRHAGLSESAFAQRDARPAVSERLRAQPHQERAEARAGRRQCGGLRSQAQHARLARPRASDSPGPERRVRDRGHPQPEHPGDAGVGRRSARRRQRPDHLYAAGHGAAQRAHRFPRDRRAHRGAGRTGAAERRAAWSSVRARTSSAATTTARIRCRSRWPRSRAATPSTPWTRFSAN